MRNLAVLWSSLCISVLILCAQDNRASLGGRVVDQQQAVVPGATVVVICLDTNVQQKTTTNHEGAWKILFLNPGHYGISITAQGFRKAEHTNVELQTADIKQID